MEFSHAQKILKGFSIPLQPHVVSKLLSVLPDLEKVSEVIHQDPCLSASVIKLVNYSDRQHTVPVEHIELAVNQLGVSGITAMMNAQLLRKAFIGDAQQLFPSEFWKITNDVAFGCSLIARQLNLSIVEQVYYLGLFHNIGMPLIWQKRHDYFETIYQASELSICQFEEKHFNCSHDTVGYYVAKGMLLDSNLCECIRLHHEGIGIYLSPQLDHQIKTCIGILKAAEYIIGELTVLYNRPREEEWSHIKEFVLEELSLTDDDFDDLSDIIETKTLSRENHK